MAKKRKRPQLPPLRGPSGQRFGITIKEYTVGSWCSTPDGTGPAEAVAIQIVTENDMSFILRLRSPRAVDTMIACLERHKADVWPDG